MSDIGVDARHKNRLNQIERVDKKARQVFSKYFPNPEHIPQQESFWKKWGQFIDEITNTFGQFRDYRRAFNLGVKNVLDYRKHYHWTVNPPSYIVTHKSPKPLRTLSWMQLAWQGYAFYQSWYFDDLCAHTAQSKEQAFRHLILSFIYHSGHANPDIVDAFQQLVATSEIQVCCWESSPFISINIESAKFNTNVTAEGKSITQFHCYLHPITLGLLCLWRRWRRKRWDPPKNENELVTLLVGRHCPLTFSQLCQTSVYVAENENGLSISQALIEYMIGKTKSYGIPTSNLARLSHPQVFPVCDVEYNRSPVTTNREAVHNSRRTHPNSSDLMDSLKECFCPKVARPQNKNALKADLDKLLSQQSRTGCIHQRILVQWYRHKLQTCGVSTLKTYHSRMTRKWMFLCETYPLHELKGDELEHLYQQVIDSHTTNKSKLYFAGRLQDLHAFAVEHGVLPAISSNYLHTDPTQSHTRAAFVDEALFTALLNSISSAKGLNEADQLCLQSMCIISYRCGLRLGELIKLRMKDIEPSNIGWISVRNTHLGKNKTASSLRKVPVKPLLLTHEADILKRYEGLRQQQGLGKKHPFFSIGADPKLPLEAIRISIFIGELLKALTQLDYFVFHHLRHSCLSRFQLMLEMDSTNQLPQQLSPYGKKQTDSIRGLIFGQSSINGYDSIASMAGHESPSMTFEHYFHFSDWIVAQKLKKANFSMSKAGMSLVGMLPKKVRVKERAEENPLPYLMKSLSVELLPANIEKGIIPSIKVDEDKEIISLPICYRALELHQQGFNDEDICSRLQISEKTLRKWIVNAKVIKEIFVESSGQRYSRHFSSARVTKLLPAPLKTAIEIKTQNQYIRDLKHHYSRNQQAIVNATIYALHHVSVSRSGIHFNSPDQLITFLEATHLFIPKSHWRAATQFTNTSERKSDWCNALKSITTYCERRSVGRSKRSQGSVRLELVHPRTRLNKTEQAKSSSHLLIHLFHMMGIMMINPHHADNNRAK